MGTDSRALLGFLAGAAAGAIAGILLAPEKGSETRKKLSKGASDMGGSLKTKFGELVDGVKESYGGGNKDRNMEDVEEKSFPSYKPAKGTV